ncbi:MAG: radical SAM protein [Candidatus Eisenbacteria bacterium]
MKVLFVYPDFGRGASGKFYHGVAFLSRALKREGHTISLFHAIDRPDPGEFVARVESLEPDLVAFSTTTNMFSSVREFAGALRKKRKVLSVCGGVHATLAPEEVIGSDGVDVVCVGEGEDALVELCQRLESGRDPTDVRNLWYKTNGKIVRNPVRPLRENLDELGFPDRSIFDRSVLEDARLERQVFLASRGCPYDCSYCCNHSLREVAEGKYVRFRSPGHVVEEIETVVREDAPRYLIFHDDVLTLNKKWLREFAELYRDRISLPFVCNSVATALDEQCLKLLKEAGCIEALIGIESGDEELRTKILRRRMGEEAILRAFHLCEHSGLESTAYNMVGLPFENMEKVLRTIKLNARARPTKIQVSIFFPFPGTRLYELCKLKSFLTSASADSYFEASTITQPSMNADEVRFVFGNFTFLADLYRLAFSIGRVSGWVEGLLDFLYFRRSKVISAFNRRIVADALSYRNRHGTKALLGKLAGRLVAHRPGGVRTVSTGRRNAGRRQVTEARP